VSLLIRNQQVAGSIPAGGSRNFLKAKDFSGAFHYQTLHFGSITLCHNCVKTPSVWGIGSCYFEREQLPQVVDIRHFRMDLMEYLEPVIVLRNQQVAGFIPAGGSRTN
jgi:hypothetical protein